MHDTLRKLVAAHAGLSTDFEQIANDTDLYRAGMKSFATIQLMLALEEAYDIELPEALLTRTTFRSVNAMAEAINTVAPGALAA